MKSNFLLALCSVALLFLSACDNGSPYGGTQNPTGVKVGKPYSVNGSTYTPKYEPNYVQEGIASWYGPDFHERMTASGEQHDQHEMTAAHKTLPMPSIVKVTRLDDGRNVNVRINDRGPFVSGRIIDLSKAAAEAIGLDRDGTTRVRVEYLPQESDQYIASLGLKAPWWGDVQYAAAAPAPEVAISSNDLPPLPAPISSASTAPTPTMGSGEIVSQPYPAPATQTTSAMAAPAPEALQPSEISQPAPIAATTVVTTTTTPIPSPAPALTASVDTSPKAIAEPNSLQVGYVSPAAGQSPQSIGKTAYRVQTGAFTNYQNAEHHADSLADVASPEIRETQVNGRTFYRVSLGPVYDATAAQMILSKVKEMGHPDARLIVE
ncbi:MAG: septal ring lytic transglycosylase RlpA family protein [Rickettsiales bacterium]